MPTYDAEARFWRDWDRLSAEQRALFLQAVRQIVEDLQARRPFRTSLRVKGFQGYKGMFEMTWAPNGRALFKYGVSPRSTDTHITWLRIGTHDIFQNP